MQRILTCCACVWFLVALCANAAQKIEPGSEYLGKVAERILEFTLESERLLQDINKNKTRISIYGTITGVFIIVIPYSASWAIDAYFPQALWVKEALHYSITPLTQATSILMLRHNFTQADENIISAEKILHESFRFFHDLGQVCKHLKDILESYSGDDTVKVVEDYLDRLREEQTPVGDYLFSIFHKLQRLQTIEFHVSKRERPIFCEIFSTLLETIKGTKLGRIKQNKVILHFSGIRISSCDFLNLKELRKHILDNYKAAGFSTSQSVAMPFLTIKTT